MCMSAQAACREIINLNGEWEFLPCGSAGADLRTPRELRRAVWSGIQVPAYYRADGWMRFGGSTLFNCGYLENPYTPRYPGLMHYAWYRRILYVQSIRRDQTVKIYCGGVAARAEVWLNGRRIGEHTGAFTPFALDAGSALRAGANELLVRVTGLDYFKPQTQVNCTCGRQSKTLTGEGNMAGIYDDVTVCILPKTHIADVFLRPALDRLDIDVEIADSGGGGGLALRAEISDQEGRAVFVQACAGAVWEERPGHIRLSVSDIDPKPWWPHAPYLYHIQLTLMQGGRAADRWEGRLGFRTFTVDRTRFMLNGRPYFLLGGDCPPHVYVPHDRAYIRKFIAWMKRGGMNFTRFHTAPASRHWLNACDAAGILVVQESGAMHQVARSETYRRELGEMVRAGRNHASVVIWSLGNECSYPFTSGHLPSFRDYAAAAAVHVKRLDPTRPVICDNHALTAEAGGDVASHHGYPGWYTFTRRAIRRLDPREPLTPWVNFRAGRPQTPEDRNGLKKFTAREPALIYNEYLAAYISNRNVFFQQGVRKRRVGKPASGALPGVCARFMEELAVFLTEQIRLLRRKDTCVAGLAPFSLLNWFHNLGSRRYLRPKPIFHAIAAVIRPVIAVIEPEQRYLRAGEPLKLQVSIINDSRGFKSVICRDAAVIAQNASGAELCRTPLPELKIPPYSHRTQAVILKIAPGSRRQPMRLSIGVSAAIVENGTIYNLRSAPKTVHVMPPLRCLPGYRNRPALQLLGSHPALSAFLAATGIRVDSIAAAGQIDPKAPLLVGPDALQALLDHPAPVQTALRGGLRLAVLEQVAPFSPDAPAALNLAPLAGAPLCLLREVSDNNITFYDYDDFVWLEQPAHPVFTGLPQALFRDWNGDGIIIRSYLQQSDGISRNRNHYGKPEYAIAPHPAVRMLASAYNDLRDGAVVEVKRGRGTILFSQLEVTRRLPDDPIAVRYLQNILHWLRRA